MSLALASDQAAFEAFAQTIAADSRLRFAPTPSGFLHAGNAYNFRLTHEAARRHPGARILLRIDDLDAERKRPEYVQDIFDTLRHLQLNWDEGPLSPADFEANWSQMLRLPSYMDMLSRLRASGLLFACGKSRRELAPFGHRYPSSFREQGLSLDAPNVSWRIQTPDGFPIPDFVVRRRDGMPAYQVASLTDDLRFGITHIVRGEDLRDSTLAQQWLAKVLGERRFAEIKFFHHALLRNEAGEKLSKSAGADSIRAARERDATL